MEKLAKNIQSKEKGNQIKENNNNNKNNNEIKKLKLNGKNNNATNNNKVDTNSESYKLMMKCYSNFNKIKSYSISNFFYISKNPGTPSLAEIEKKIKNYEFNTIEEFFEELRKFWNYQFKNHSKEPKIYQNICKLSIFCEKLFKDLSNDNLDSAEKKEITSIKKRAEKIKKDLNEIKGNNNQNNTINKNNKLKLGQQIKSLTKEQLKGIVPLLADKNDTKNSKMFCIIAYLSRNVSSGYSLIRQLS